MLPFTMSPILGAIGATCIQDLDIGSIAESESGASDAITAKLLAKGSIAESMSGVSDAITSRFILEPTGIANNTLWLRSSVGVTQGGGTASQWVDSVNSRTFAQATGAIQPVYSSSDANVNSAPSLIFSPTDSCMTCASSIAIKHIFVVAYYPTATFPALSTIMTKGAAGGDFLFRGAGGSTADWRTSDDAAGTRVRDGVTTNVALTSANVPHIYDKVLTSTATASTWTIGRDPGTTGRQWKGGIVEIIAFSAAITGSDYTSLLSNLKARYGTP